jgi:hypothetical protein
MCDRTYHGEVVHFTEHGKFRGVIALTDTRKSNSFADENKAPPK